MRLVAHVAKKYQNTDYDMEDLLSVGTIGLIKAVNTFHPDRGSRLATYAAKCVENDILSQRLFLQYCFQTFDDCSCKKLAT
jgi:RNA polymerase sporulation-specific sigma factor